MTTPTRLRTVADILEQHPNLPAPSVSFYQSGNVSVHWYLCLDSYGMVENMQKHYAAEIVRALGGKWNKEESGDDFRFAQQRDGIDYTILVKRSAVCERIVVGTETVTVPAMPAREALPARIETREVVEWRCEPLLADVS